MKKMLVAMSLFFGLTVSFSQTSSNVIVEEIGENTIKVKFLHENGEVMHEGCYINGKFEGLWKSYDEFGSIIAEGNFSNGLKSGLWNFYNDDKVDSVIYQKNEVTEVKKFQKYDVAVK